MKTSTLKANRFTTEEKKAALLDYSSTSMTSEEVSKKHGMHLTSLSAWSRSENELAKTGFSDSDFAHRRHRGRQSKSTPAPHSQVDGMVRTVQEGSGKPIKPIKRSATEPEQVHASFCPKCGVDIAAVSMAMTATARRATVW